MHWWANLTQEEFNAIRDAIDQESSKLQAVAAMTADQAGSGVKEYAGKQKARKIGEDMGFEDWRWDGRLAGDEE